MSFTCPQCGAESFNPTDEREGYCGRCNAFTREIHTWLKCLDVELKAGHIDQQTYDIDAAFYRAAFQRGEGMPPIQIRPNDTSYTETARIAVNLLVRMGASFEETTSMVVDSFPGVPRGFIEGEVNAAQAAWRDEKDAAATDAEHGDPLPVGEYELTGNDFILIDQALLNMAHLFPKHAPALTVLRHRFDNNRVILKEPT